MGWGTNDVRASMALDPYADTQVRLRGSVERTLFLSIGSAVEITLHERHVLALREDIATALGDMESVDGAVKVAEAAHGAGAQARRAAVLAREQADAAERAGEVEPARRLRQEADAAVVAADAALAAAEAAARALDTAEEATERITRTVAEAADSAGAAARLCPEYGG